MLNSFRNQVFFAGVFSSLPKDPMILILAYTPPPPKADGGTQDSDSGKCGLLSPFAAIQNIGVVNGNGSATKLQSPSTVTGPGFRSWLGVAGGEQPPAHQKLNIPGERNPLDLFRNQVFCSSGKEKIYEGPQCTNVHEDPDKIFDAARRQKTPVSMKSFKKCK